MWRRGKLPRSGVYEASTLKRAQDEERGGDDEEHPRVEKHPEDSPHPDRVAGFEVGRFPESAHCVQESGAVDGRDQNQDPEEAQVTVGDSGDGRPNRSPYEDARHHDGHSHRPLFHRGHVHDVAHEADSEDSCKQRYIFPRVVVLLSCQLTRNSSGTNLRSAKCTVKGKVKTNYKGQRGANPGFHDVGIDWTARFK